MVPSGVTRFFSDFSAKKPQRQRYQKPSQMASRPRWWHPPFNEVVAFQLMENIGGLGPGRLDIWDPPKNVSMIGILRDTRNSNPKPPGTKPPVIAISWALQIQQKISVTIRSQAEHHRTSTVKGVLVLYLSRGLKLTTCVLINSYIPSLGLLGDHEHVGATVARVHFAMVHLKSALHRRYPLFLWYLNHAIRGKNP